MLLVQISYTNNVDLFGTFKLFFRNEIVGSKAFDVTLQDLKKYYEGLSDLVTFTEENLNRRLHFLCSVVSLHYSNNRHQSRR